MLDHYFYRGPHYITLQLVWKKCIKVRKTVTPSDDIAGLVSAIRMLSSYLFSLDQRKPAFL